MRKPFFVLPALFALLLLLAGARASHAQSTSRVTANGAFLYNGSYVATYVNAATANGIDSGLISLTTYNQHLWGYVDYIAWVSPNEAHVFAHLIGQNASIEVDVMKSGAKGMIAFGVFDDNTNYLMAATGIAPMGTLTYVPLNGPATVLKAN